MARKKRNALKHGANTKEVMLWANEKYKDYEALRTGLSQEYTPDGATEEYLVQTILDLLWRRRRLDRHGQITTQKGLDEIVKANDRGRHMDVLLSLAPEFKKATTAEQVEAMLARFDPIYRNTILKFWPLPTSEGAGAWGPKIAAGLVSIWKPQPRCEGDDVFLAVVDLNAFDISLARNERLDAMIDRTIKRLMQVKTMKQMYGRLEPKLINLTPTKGSAATGRDQKPDN